jgi:hypothetical protein
MVLSREQNRKQIPKTKIKKQREAQKKKKKKERSELLAALTARIGWFAVVLVKRFLELSIARQNAFF